MVEHRRRLFAMALLIAALSLAGCTARETPNYDAPAQLKAIPGSTLHLVTLSPRGMRALGVRTEPVRKGAAAASLTFIPTTAVIYDPLGKPWTYTIPAPRTFVRKPIVIDHFVGELAYLRSGPPAGTTVVTVGAPELLGAEYGVGEE